MKVVNVWLVNYLIFLFIDDWFPVLFRIAYLIPVNKSILIFLSQVYELNIHN